MASKRRVYIIRESHEVPEDRIFSSLTKARKNLNADLSYSALSERLRRAKERTGKSLIRLKDKDGKAIMIEIREVE